MISLQPFKNFQRKRDVVSVFVIVDSKILMLKRQKGKSQEKRWGPPAGKVDDGETLEEAICRETMEETGLQISPENILKSKDIYYVKHKGIHFCFYVFSIKFDSLPKVKIQPKEHSHYKWVSPKKALTMPLIEDEEVPIKNFNFK